MRRTVNNSYHKSIRLLCCIFGDVYILDNIEIFTVPIITAFSLAGGHKIFIHNSKFHFYKLIKKNTNFPRQLKEFMGYYTNTPLTGDTKSLNTR